MDRGRLVGIVVSDGVHQVIGSISVVAFRAIGVNRLDNVFHLVVAEGGSEAERIGLLHQSLELVVLVEVDVAVRVLVLGFVSQAVVEDIVLFAFGVDCRDDALVSVVFVLGRVIVPVFRLDDVGIHIVLIMFGIALLMKDLYNPVQLIVIFFRLVVQVVDDGSLIPRRVVAVGGGVAFRAVRRSDRFRRRLVARRIGVQRLRAVRFMALHEIAAGIVDEFDDSFLGLARTGRECLLLPGG